jgi:hypothetical protein
VAVREVRYARGGTDGVMHVYARTRELVFVRIKYFDGGNAYNGHLTRRFGVADAGTNGECHIGSSRDFPPCIVS